MLFSTVMVISVPVRVCVMPAKAAQPLGRPETTCTAYWGGADSRMTMSALTMGAGSRSRSPGTAIVAVGGRGVSSEDVEPSGGAGVSAMAGGVGVTVRGAAAVGDVVRGLMGVGAGLSPLPQAVIIAARTNAAAGMRAMTSDRRRLVIDMKVPSLRLQV
jgi:hypothetical protein